MSRLAVIRDATPTYGPDDAYEVFVSHNSKTGFSVNVAIARTCRPTKGCSEYCYALAGRLTWIATMRNPLKRATRNLILSIIDKIAPICAYLASDLSADVTGQIFAVRMNEIYLMSQSRPIRSVHRDGGWTPQTIAEHGMPAMKGSFYKLDRSADIFSWDPV